MLREVAVVLFFAFLACLATRPLVFHLETRTLAGPDPMIDLWTVDWLSKHVLTPSQFFGGNIFHPAPHAVLFSDLSLGTVGLVAPLHGVIGDPVPLYNVALLLALAFSGWSFCALTRGLTGSLVAGLTAGTLAAFGSHQMSHIYHLNLLTTGWLALFLLGLQRLGERPSWRAALLAGVSASLAAQSSGYYAVATALLGLVFSAAHWRALREPGGLRYWLAAGLLAVALTGPYLWSFLSLKRAQGLRRTLAMSEQMAFQPARDLGSHTFVYRWLVGSGGERLFPGILPLALIAVAVVRRSRHVRPYLAAVALLLLVSLGPKLDLGTLSVPLPYAALFAIPPLDAMRHPYTFAAVATLLLAVLAGLGASQLRLARRPWGAAAIVALAVAETLAPAPRVRDAPEGVPPVYRLLDSLPPGPILEVPVFAEDTLLWAARHGRQVVNGIGAFAPFPTLMLERYVRNHWVERVPDDVDTSRPTPFLIERFAVRYVIVPAGRRPEFKPLAAAFDRSRVFRFVAAAEDGDRLYEALRASYVRRP